MSLLIPILLWLAKLAGLSFIDPTADAALVSGVISVAETPEAQALAKSVAGLLKQNGAQLAVNAQTGAITHIYPPGVNPGLGHGGDSMMRGE